MSCCKRRGADHVHIGVYSLLGSFGWSGEKGTNINVKAKVRKSGGNNLLRVQNKKLSDCD